MVHVLDPRTHVFCTRRRRDVRVFILFRQQTKPVQQRRWHGLHHSAITRSNKVQQTQTGDVNLVLGRRDHAVDGRFDEAYRGSAYFISPNYRWNKPFVRKVNVSAALQVIPPSTGLTHFHAPSGVRICSPATCCEKRSVKLPKSVWPPLVYPWARSHSSCVRTL